MRAVRWWDGCAGDFLEAYLLGRNRILEMRVVVAVMVAVLGREKGKP